jgi:hypothetical protein
MIFSKSVEKVQVWLKSDKNSEYFRWDLMAEFFWEWEIFQINFRENRNTHFVFNKFFRWKSWGLWGNVETYGKPDRPQKMRLACRMTKAIDAHSEYVIFLDFPLQQWLRTRASLLHHTHTSGLVRFSNWTMTSPHALWQLCYIVSCCCAWHQWIETCRRRKCIPKSCTLFNCNSESWHAINFLTSWGVTEFWRSTLFQRPVNLRRFCYRFQNEEQQK